MANNPSDNLTCRYPDCITAKLSYPNSRALFASEAFRISGATPFRYCAGHAVVAADTVCVVDAINNIKKATIQEPLWCMYFFMSDSFVVGFFSDIKNTKNRITYEDVPGGNRKFLQ